MSDGDTQKQLAAALGRVPSGLYILTASDGVHETGMLVSWVMQAGFEPPSVTVALKKGRYVNDWLTEGAVFVLNILDADQTDMVAHFGRGFGRGEPAFANLDIDRAPGRPPVLKEALGFLECRVLVRHSLTDHDVLIAQIAAGKMLGEGQPMVHVRKNGLHY